MHRGAESSRSFDAFTLRVEKMGDDHNNLTRNSDDNANTILKAMENMKIEMTQNINSNIDQKFSLMKEATNELKTSIDDHEKQLKQIKRNERKKNLIIYDIPDKEENYEDLETSYFKYSTPT